MIAELPSLVNGSHMHLEHVPFQCSEVPLVLFLPQTWFLQWAVALKSHCFYTISVDWARAFTCSNYLLYDFGQTLFTLNLLYLFPRQQQRVLLQPQTITANRLPISLMLRTKYKVLTKTYKALTASSSRSSLSSSPHQPLPARSWFRTCVPAVSFLWHLSYEEWNRNRKLHWIDSTYFPKAPP